MRDILYVDEHITLASNVSSCAILGFSFVDDDADGDNIVCKIINVSLNETEFILDFRFMRNWIRKTYT